MLLACTAEVSGGDRRLERPLLDGDARLAKSREDRPLHRGKMSDGRVADQMLNSRGVGGKHLEPIRDARRRVGCGGFQFSEPLGERLPGPSKAPQLIALVQESAAGRQGIDREGLAPVSFETGQLRDQSALARSRGLSKRPPRPSRFSSRSSSPSGPTQVLP